MRPIDYAFTLQIIRESVLCFACNSWCFDDTVLTNSQWSTTFGGKLLWQSSKSNGTKSWVLEIPRTTFGGNMQNWNTLVFEHSRAYLCDFTVIDFPYIMITHPYFWHYFVGASPVYIWKNLTFYKNISSILAREIIGI